MTHCFSLRLLFTLLSCFAAGCKTNTEVLNGFDSMPYVSSGDSIYVTNKVGKRTALRQLGIRDGELVEISRRMFNFQADKIVASPGREDYWSYFVTGEPTATGTSDEQMIIRWHKDARHSVSTTVERPRCCEFFPELQCAVYCGYEEYPYANPTIEMFYLPTEDATKFNIIEVEVERVTFAAGFMVVFDVKNKWLAITSPYGEVRLWFIKEGGVIEAQDLELRLPLNKTSGLVWTDLSEDLEWISMSDDSQLAVWNRESGERVFHESYTTKLESSSAFVDSSHVAVVRGSEIAVIDIHNGSEEKQGFERNGRSITTIEPVDSQHFLLTGEQEFSLVTLNRSPTAR